MKRRSINRKAHVVYSANDASYVFNQQTHDTRRVQCVVDIVYYLSVICFFRVLLLLENRDGLLGLGDCQVTQPTHVP